MRVAAAWMIAAIATGGCGCSDREDPVIRFELDAGADSDTDVDVDSDSASDSASASDSDSGSGSDSDSGPEFPPCTDEDDCSEGTHCWCGGPGACFCARACGEDPDCYPWQICCDGVCATTECCRMGC